MSRTGGVMMVLFIFLIALFTVVTVPLVEAADAPHGSANNIGCNDCHMTHNAPGPGLTSYAANENLCMSCHNTVGQASAWPMNDSMQADMSAKRGTSHPWTKSMPTVANSVAGLRTKEQVTNFAMQRRLDQFDGKVTCSVCHDQHRQYLTPWKPGVPPSGAGRRFMRMTNLRSELCEDCHAYRLHTDVSNYTGEILSHPVNVVIPGTGPYLSMPIEPCGDAQQGARGETDGACDSNPTNNLVKDPDGKIRCMSCHHPHYTDSDGSTVDGPP